MDCNEKKAAAAARESGPGRYWTNEKHSQFLNSMEASFVRLMFENKVSCCHLLRLDRNLPDTFDSTQDSEHNTCAPVLRRCSTSASPGDGMGMGQRSPRMGKKKRGRLPQPYISLLLSQQDDQVVPQIEN